MFCVWNFSLCEEVNFSELICESGMKISPRYALKAFNNKKVSVFKPNEEDQLILSLYN